MSAVNTSVSTESSVGSESRLTSTAISSEVPTATPGERHERARGAQLDQLGLAAAAVMPRPPVSSKKASSSERETATSSESATPCVGGHLAHHLGRGAAHQQRAGRSRRRPRCPGSRSSARPSRSASAARTRVTGPVRRRRAPARAGRCARSTPVRDHHDVVDALGDLGEQVAGHQHGAAAAGLVRAAGRASSGCRAGRGRWRARRGSAPRGRRAARRRSRAAGACPSSSPSRAGRARVGRGRPASSTSSTRARRMAAGGGQHAQVVAAAAARDGSSRPRARRRPGARMRQLARSAARRRSRCRRSGGPGRAACAASCSCRRRWGRGTPVTRPAWTSNERSVTACTCPKRLLRPSTWIDVSQHRTPARRAHRARVGLRLLLQDERGRTRPTS